MVKPEPTATEAAAYVAVRIAHAGAYIVIAFCLFFAWIGTP